MGAALATGCVILVNLETNDCTAVSLLGLFSVLDFGPGLQTRVHLPGSLVSMLTQKNGLFNNSLDVV